MKHQHTANSEHPLRGGGKSVAVLSVGFAYAVALAAGIAAVRVVRPEGIFLQFALADGVATLVIFLFSTIFRNASFYDPYWSVKPIVVAVWWMWIGDAAWESTRARMVLVLVVLYGLRLTWNWLRGWTGLDHEDWRYRDLRQKTGKAFPLVNFSGIHFFPTVLVYLGCLPLYDVFLEPENSFGVTDLFAGLILFAGIACEALADQQLRRFRLSKKTPGTLLESGLWRYARHPNYFGEMMVWWGIAVFGWSAGGLHWYTFAGCMAITGLFVFISVPLIDKRMLARYPAYAERMKRVSALIPFKVHSVERL